MKTITLLLLTGFASTAALLASPFEGRWYGTVPGPRGDMELTWVFTETDGSIAGTVATPFGEFPLANFSADGDSIFFVIPFGGVLVYYNGTINDDTIEFHTEGMGGERTVIATRGPALFEGKWRGILEGPEGAFELVFTFRTIDGVLSGSVSSERGEAHIETGSVSGGTITFTTRFEGMPIEHNGTMGDGAISMRAVSPDWNMMMTLERM